MSVVVALVDLADTSQLPQASRRRLSRDAEKSKAALDLWEYQDKLMEWALPLFFSSSHN